MYRYETHLHTAPVSGCARATAEESVDFYHSIGYDGVFITNHFWVDEKSDQPIADQLRFFFSDYDKAKKRGDEIGLRVFPGAEMSLHGGIHFLVYGVEPAWFIENWEFALLPMTEQFPILRKMGALIVHAHPYREMSDYTAMCLFPKAVHGVEIMNGKREPHENHMARLYCEEYGLIPFAGSDNHVAGNPRQKYLGGVAFDTPITSVAEFVARAKNREAVPFAIERETLREIPVTFYEEML